jgi:hypothetical protein
VRNPAFVSLVEEIKQLHESKNHDYAEDADPLSNLRGAERLGIPAWKGVLVRLQDKWSRMEQLANGKSPKHESMRDSLIDNAIYSLLCVLLLDEASSSSALPPPTSDRSLTETISVPSVWVPLSALSGGVTQEAQLTTTCAEPESLMQWAPVLGQ